MGRKFLTFDHIFGPKTPTYPWVVHAQSPPRRLNQIFSAGRPLNPAGPAHCDSVPGCVDGFQRRRAALDLADLVSNRCQHLRLLAQDPLYSALDWAAFHVQATFFEAL